MAHTHRTRSERESARRVKRDDVSQADSRKCAKA
jgi:hypothetical protein